MIRVLLLFIFTLAAVAQIPKSIVVGSSQYLTYSAPAYTATSYTVEFGIAALSTPGATQYIWTDGEATTCSITTGFVLTCNDGPGSAIVSLSLNGRTDIRARLIKDTSLLLLRLEIWNANGATYATNSFGDSNTSEVRSGAVGGVCYNPGVGASGGGTMRFARVYTHSTVANSAPPSEAPTSAGDKGDWRFESTLTDSGSAGLTLTLNGGGSTTYADSAVFAPIATISPVNFPSRSGSPLALTSQSFTSTLGNGVPASIFWIQIPGTYSGSFSSRTTTPTNFTATVAGSYTIQLTAKDGLGVSSAATTTVGVVSTDSQGIVVTGLSTVKDLIIGPQLRSGLSPWLYADYAMKVARELKTIAIAQPPTQDISTGLLLTGTCTLSNSPATCTGAGTAYNSQLSPGDRVLIAWNTIDGNGTGRLYDVVATRADDTHFTINSFTVQATLGSGLSVYKLGPDIHATINGSDALLWAPYLWQTPQPGSFYWPYYDNFLGILREKYRTGLDDFKTDADVLNENQWKYGTDHARFSGTPRTYNFESLYLYALDHTNRFLELYNLVQYLMTTGGGIYNPTSLSSIPNVDTREMGYVTGAQALGAMTDTDPTRHNNYCSQLDTSAAAWITNQNGTGYWAERPQGFTYAPAYGQTAWKMALPVHNLQLSYNALKDYCGNSSRASSLLTTIAAAMDFLYLYGRNDLTRDGFFDELYPNNGQMAGTVTGTVSVTVGSPIVTGAGTSFTTTFAGPSYIAIPDGGGNFNSHRVSLVTDNTHLTLADNWGSQVGEVNHSGVTATRSDPSGTSCGTIVTLCNDPNRSFVTQLAGIHGWMIHYCTPQPSCATTYKTRGDEVFSASYGGPADGPGGTAACGGPNCDGTITFVTEGFYNCPNIASGTSGFCSSNGTAIGPYKPNSQKNFGEGFGVPASQSYLADRIGILAPATPRTHLISCNITAIPGATKCAVTVTEASGTATTTVCTSSPCSVSADARQGVALVSIAYKNVSDVLLWTAPTTKLTIN